MFIDDVSNTLNFLVKTSKDIVNYPAIQLKGLMASVKGNARVLIVTQPAFSIPTAFVGVYQQLFIISLGVTPIEYGKLVGLGIGVQLLSFLLGGILADKIGHKRTHDIFILTWPLSLTLFAFAQNIWWVIPAVIISNMMNVSSPAWNCLFVEGIPENKRSNIYAVVHMSLNGGALFLPVAGAVVKMMGFDTASRVLYLTSAAMTVVAIIYRWRKLKETSLGEKIRDTSSALDLYEESRSFGKTFKILMQDKKIFWYGLVNVIFMLAITMWGAFNSIYLCDPKEIGLDSASITVFPVIAAMIFIAAIIVLVPQIKKHNYLKYISLGILLNAVSATLYIFAPEKNMSFIVLSYMIYGVGLALFRPLYDARLMNVFKDKERARLYSVYNVIVMGCSIPGGLLSGYLYTLYPRSLFITTAVLFVIAFWILRNKVEKRSKESN